MFYVRVSLYKKLAPKIQSQNVTRKKLQNMLLYKKFACIMLMKLTPGLLVCVHSLKPGNSGYISLKWKYPEHDLNKINMIIYNILQY